MAVYVAVYVAVVAAVWAGVIMIIAPSSGGGGGRDAIVLGREKMTCKSSSERAREKGSHEGRIRNEKETARGGREHNLGKERFPGGGPAVWMAQLKRAGWGWIWTQRARIGKERQEGETERDERDRDGNSVNTWQRPVLLREGRQSRQSREAGGEENERQKHRGQQTETGTETETDADADAEAERETAAPTARDMAITCM